MGLIISSFPGVMYGLLHFCITEHEKSEALRQNAGNFDAFMSLTPFSREKLQWWVDCIITAVNKIDIPDPQITIRTDASTQGWGVRSKWPLYTGAVDSYREGKPYQLSRIIGSVVWLTSL